MLTEFFLHFTTKLYSSKNDHYCHEKIIIQVKREQLSNMYYRSSQFYYMVKNIDHNLYYYLDSPNSKKQKY